MATVGLERELDQLLEQTQDHGRYLDLCLLLRRPMARIIGAPGRQLDLVAQLRWQDVVLRPCSPVTLPESGEVLIPVSSAPEAIGASTRVPAGVDLAAPSGVEARFEPEDILRAGGSWDRLTKGWARPRPAVPHVVDLEESQIEFVRWFAGWLTAFRQGEYRDDSSAIVFGGRRGGKTFAGLLCLLAGVIDVPEMLGWAISVSHVERDVDIDRNVLRLLPANWYRYREWPAHKFHFVNGSTITNVSADDPEGAKRGQADLVLLNEGAKMPALVYQNALGGTADRGGLVITTSNPPQTTKGEWVEVEVTAAAEAVAKGEAPDARVFRVDHKLNRAIDQGARARIGRILRRLNPALADADDEGMMRPVGDRALYAFQKLRHAMRPRPDLGAITEAFTRAKRGRPYAYLMGVDFQRRPHIAATFWELFGDLDRPDLWGVAGVAVEGNEDDFLDALEADGRFHPMNTLAIADATGVNQDYAHANGKTSWGPFFARAWDIVGPQPKKTDKGTAPQNPRVELSLGQANRLLQEDRVHLVPDLPLLTVMNNGRVLLADGVAAAFKDCKAKVVRFGLHPVGQQAHLVDTYRYVAWWVDPPKEAPRAAGRLNRPAVRR